MQARITVTEDEGKEAIPAFDYTKLTAINTCPRWGLIRYDQHKRMPGNGRNTALEMGSAAHECFSAVRYFELLEYGAGVYGDSFSPESLHEKGVKLFGADRLGEIVRLHSAAEDVRRRVNSIALYVANTSGFYDDPSDRRRTLSNLETSIVSYIDRTELGKRLPIIQPFIGIEVPFDITITFDQNPPSSCCDSLSVLIDRLRYVGRVDALVHPHNDVGKVEAEENKTASRLNNPWQDSFLTSHQVTGYCVAASKLMGIHVTDAMIRGMMIPLPKTYDLEGIVNMPVSRDGHRVREWLKWVYHTYETWKRWKDDPLNAPEYTHSCNRYFVSCSFIPLCAMADPVERALNFSLMEHDEWSPLKEGHSNE